MAAQEANSRHQPLSERQDSCALEEKILRRKQTPDAKGVSPIKYK